MSKEPVQYRDDVPREYFHDDEIHVGELIRNLLEKKVLIGAITMVGTLLAVIVALLLPKIYQVQAVVSLPNGLQIAPIVQNAYFPSDVPGLTVNDVFSDYLRNLNSNRNLRTLFDREKLIDQLNIKKDDDANTVFFDFLEDFSVKIVTPEYLDLPKDAEIPKELIAITIETPYPTKIAPFLNDYLAFAEQRTLAEIKSNSSGYIQGRKAEINRRIEQLSGDAKRTRQVRIAQLKEALTIAKTVGIKDPMSLQEAMVVSESFSPEKNDNSMAEQAYLASQAALASAMSSTQTDKVVTLGSLDSQNNNSNDQKADFLYLKGEKLLQAELERLVSRTDDALYIPEIARLQSEQAVLNSYSLDFNGAEVKHIELEAFPPKNAYKPNRKLIVAIALVGSFFIAIFIALISIAVKRDEEIHPH